MLIPFKIYNYTPSHEEKPRKTGIVWLNPIYVLSVKGLTKDKFGVERCTVVMAAREDEESNYEYILKDHADHISTVVNTTIIGTTAHAPS